MNPSSRKLVYTLGAVLAGAAFGLYFWLGNPGPMAIGGAQSDPAAMVAAPGEHDFMKLIRKLEEKTQANPDDGEAWSRLARTYAETERWPEAQQAYEKAAKLLPQDAVVLSGYAEAMAITNKRVLTARIMELVQQALEIDPADRVGLELAGIHAYQDQNFMQASDYFRRLHQLLPPESLFARDILAAQQEAERLAGMAGLDNLSSPLSTAVKAAAAGGAAIKGSIDIAPALRSRLVDTDVLFLFARPDAGGPPVAAIRASGGQLPLEFVLDDSTSMSLDNALSQQRQVTLVARLSKSGNTKAQPGDLEGRALGVAVGAKGVKLVIDQVLP